MTLLPAVLAAAAAAVAIGFPPPSRLQRSPGGAVGGPVQSRPERSSDGAVGGSVQSRQGSFARGAYEPGAAGAFGLAADGRLRRQALPALLSAVVLVVWGPVAAALSALLAVLARGRLLARHERLLRDAERAGAAEALAVLAAELAAGRPAATSLAAAASVATGPFARGLAAAAASGRVGADPGACLFRWAEHSAVPEVLRGLAACWEVCGATGSSLAAAVGWLADGLRAERAQRLAVEAELAGPRATAMLLAGLPVVGIALAAGLGAQPLRVLFHTPVGAACLVVGIALDLLGLWWTGRLVAAAGGAR